MQQEPHGSRGSLVEPLARGSVENPEVPARSVMVRPDAEGGSTRGDERRRKPSRRSAGDVLRRGLGGSGTTAVEPGRMGSSALESAELSTSYSSEFEAVEHRRREGAAGGATHHGPAARKSFASENPRSGSGPSVSARPEGEQTVEGVRNPEDGRLRVRQTRGSRSLRRCRCRGGKPQEGRPGQAWPGRASGPEPCEGDEACGSCRAVFGPHGRPVGGMPRGRTNDVEAAANQCCRYAGRSAPRGRSTL
jgi:hypothetical protein